MKNVFVFMLLSCLCFCVQPVCVSASMSNLEDFGHSIFEKIKITGKVVDNKQAPLEFANVVLQAADKFFATYSDENGIFELQVIPGNDTLKVSMLGYKPYEKVISLQSDVDLGEIQLEDRVVGLQEAVVTARRITRMPDRFIMNLANDPSVFGKDGKDVLNTAPGVFIQERDGVISVNGKSGTQVYVNERPLHYSGTDLVRYLQNLKAENIVKIEVLPNAGSEYDASITGGIIKITLKNRRDDGIDGSFGASGNFAPSDKEQSALSPFFNLNYRINKLSLYSQLNYNRMHTVEHIIEDVDNWTINQKIHNDLSNPQTIDDGAVRLGGIYDLSDKQSVGLEVNYSIYSVNATNSANLTNIINGNQTDIASHYNGTITVNNYSASANYLLRLDSLGSMFKVLLDYFHKTSANKQNYNSQFSGAVNLDSIYRSNIPTTNNTYAITADWSHHFNEISKLNVGVKYARNAMDNSMLYEYLQGTAWHEIVQLSNAGSFTENISAIYGMFSSRIQKVSYSLGLRGEYTEALPYTDKTDETKTQKYFKLFPSINVMFPFSENGQHSLVANYHRTIARPSFMQLNPFRFLASEFLYIAGNPKLQPAISDDGSLSLNLFYKYNLTAGVTNVKNDFGGVRIPDPNAPGVIVQTTGNISKNTTGYLSFSGPVNPAKWWQIYLNLTGKRNSLDVLGNKLSINVFSCYMNNSFSLPKEFKLDISGWYQSPVINGNIKYTIAAPQINFTLRKQFLKNRLTATLFINNLFNFNKTLMEVNETDFSQIMYDRSGFRAIGASLSYSFQSGKKVSDKKVETGAAEEKARMR